MIEVAGNNLAAIVCCSELVRRGIPVRHLSNHDYRLGGHFAGLLYDGKRIDLGMVLLEPRFDQIETDIAKYQGQFGQQINQFNQAVYSWLSSRNIVLDLIAVKSHFRNQLIGDVVIADDLAFLSLLSLPEQQAIIEEISIRIQESEYHPRDKAHSIYFQENSLRDVYSEIYGSLFSRYLLSNLELLAGPIGPELVAQLHRLLWAPLFYPENILSYLKTGNSGIPCLNFFVPNNGSISQLVEDIIEEMKMSSHYSSQLFTNDQYSSMVKNCIQSKSSRTVVFADERDLFNENLDSKSTLVAFVVAKTDSNLEIVVHNLDSTSKWYRATLRGQDLGVITIEIGEIMPDETDESILARASQCSSSVGAGTLIEPMILKTKIQIFSPQVAKILRNRHLQTKSIVANNRSCYLTNETTGSFNNQVCLGLQSSRVIIADVIK